MRIPGRRLWVKPTGFLGCLLLVAPGLAAQNTSYGAVGMEGIGTIGPDGRTITTTKTVLPPNPCPVSVEASYLSDGNIVRTGTGLPKAEHAKGMGQRLHLKLKSPDERMIDRVTVNLRGWTSTGRTEQLGQMSASKESSLKMQTLTVFLLPGADHTATVDVWANGLTAVVSVELLSVKYSDGSTWTPTQGKSCRVTPDHLMLITER